MSALEEDVTKQRSAVASTERGPDDSSEDGLFSYRWTDKGRSRPDGSIEHESLEVVVKGVQSIVSVGDVVFLKSGDGGDGADSKFYGEDKKDYYSADTKEGTPTDAYVARVERMWEDPTGMDDDDSSRETGMKFQARWFFKKKDVESLLGTFEGPLSREELLSAMTSQDVVLSNQADENDVLSIMGKCAVVHRQPSQDPTPLLSTETFVCRYSIEFGGESKPGTVHIKPYEGDNDEWPSMQDADRKGEKRSATQEESTYLSTKRARVDSDMDGGAESTTQLSGIEQDEESPSRNDSEGRSSLDDSSNESSSSSSSSSSKESAPSNKDTDAGAVSSDDEMELSDDMSSSSFKSLSDQEDAPQETEGRTTIGEIHVGEAYQAVVPPFTANKQSSCTTRNPTLLWKSDSIQDEELDKFFGQAAHILNEYLEQNELLTDDPYTPLSADLAEAKALSEGQEDSTTISHVSTGSSVSTAKNKLTRECRVDALMHVLLKNKFDTKAALEAIAASPQDVLTIWTTSEKDMFDAGFRRYSGSLRMISKQGLAASKTYKDVVDYHYRFKIPDQFRRYQEKKRELAVRMMECIENRRYYESLIPSRSENSSGKSTLMDNNPNAEERKQTRDWTKTSGTELVGATEDRRVAAKELLYEVKSAMGKAKMIQVASAVKSYQYRSIPDLKESLVELLQGQPELLERFLDFLPLRFR